MGRHLASDLLLRFPTLDLLEFPVPTLDLQGEQVAGGEL